MGERRVVDVLGEGVVLDAGDAELTESDEAQEDRSRSRAADADGLSPSASHTRCTLADERNDEAASLPVQQTRTALHHPSNVASGT